MGCLENVCNGCGAYNMGNDIWYICPQCKSTDVRNWFDEPTDDWHIAETSVEDED